MQELIFTQQLRAKRKGKVGNSWYVDATYIWVKGNVLLTYARLR